LQKGFTLIELAIVVVVLGIVVTGVVAGQSIIDSSKRYKVINDVTEFKTAISAFRLEYDGIPGDFDEAEDYWQTDTDNGNGDKKILGRFPFENLLFWNHLHLAGIIKESKTTRNRDEYNPEKPHLTFPVAPVSSNTYYVLARNITSTLYQDYKKVYNATMLGLVGIGEHNFSGYSTNNYSGYNKSVSVTPKFAYNIDKKIDDGKPRGGYVVGLMPSGSTSTINGWGSETACSQLSSYNLDNTEITCSLHFVIHSSSGKFAP
jgi:prepilin-type N-terminal cleavage/methylation domain-containing protein